MKEEKILDIPKEILPEGMVPCCSLGAGSFGKVKGLLHLHKPTDLAEKQKQKETDRWIIKVSHLNSLKRKDTFEREVYFLNYLKKEGHIDLIPELKDSKICPHDTGGSHGFQIMRRYDGNMKQLGKKQAQEHKLSKKSLLFTEEQWHTMVKLAMSLESLKISHGDFKITNLLYRMNNSGGNVDIRVSDFGFAGFFSSDNIETTNYKPLLGFTKRFCKTKNNRFKNSEGTFVQQEGIPSSLLPILNRGQLFLECCRFLHNRIKLYKGKEKLHEEDLIKLFQFEKEEVKELKQFFPNFLGRKKFFFIYL